MTLTAIRQRVEPFARQRLIPGWDQRRVETSRVLVAGIGALGNACAADLILTGVRHLVLADNDSVDTSNLSRTILFRRGDEGRRKVDVARQRLAAMAPMAHTRILAIDTDVVWGLGWGVYRRVDVVLACVDSAEARIALGSSAWTFGVPAVVGGIFGFDGGMVVQGIGDAACVGCTFGPAEWSERASRYSCDNVRRIGCGAALAPATQVLASLTGALMVSEALQVLHGDVSRASARLFFDGRGPALCRIRLRRRPRCPSHLEIGHVYEDPALSSQMTAGALLEHLASSYGRCITVGLGRDFLVSGACKGCRQRIPLGRPRHATSERDLLCETCWSASQESLGDPALEIVSVLSLATPRGVLDLTLEALGIPRLHVLAINAGETTRWIELTGDADRMLPGWPAGDQRERRS